MGAEPAALDAGGTGRSETSTNVGNFDVLVVLQNSLEELQKLNNALGQAAQTDRASAEQDRARAEQDRDEPKVGFASTVSTVVFGFAVTSFQSAFERWFIRGPHWQMSYTFDNTTFDPTNVWARGPATESQSEYNKSESESYYNPSALKDFVPWKSDFYNLSDSDWNSRPQPEQVVLQRPAKGGFVPEWQDDVILTFLVLVSLVILLSAAATCLFIV